MIYDPTRKWQIALTDIILPNDNGHWLYVKVPKEEGLTTSEVFASEAHVDPLRDDGFTIYKMGYAHPVVDGTREISMLWGNVKRRTNSVLSKATGVEVTTGTDDSKYLTPKSVKDSNILQGNGIKRIEPITQAEHEAMIAAGTTVATTLYLYIG